MQDPEHQLWWGHQEAVAHSASDGKATAEGCACPPWGGMAVVRGWGALWEGIVVLEVVWGCFIKAWLKEMALGGFSEGIGSLCW